jgi:carbon monoxide dehydrogenase subunit G
MKYSEEIEINKPIEKVIELFDNPDNLKKWMEGLQSFEHLSGTPGQPGAKSKLKFKMGNREMEMIETVITRNLPHEFTGSYEAKGGYNIVKNKFVKLSGTRTKHITEHEFRFKGFMKVIAFLFSGMFKKQSMKYLKAFKEFVEKS